MSKKIIVLVGPPCSGKSTIGKLAADKIPKARYISSGDIARKMAEQCDVIKCDIDSGRLAPEMEMRKSILHELIDALLHNDTIILDGFPRFHDQLKFLNNVIPTNIEIKYVLIYTRLSTIIERSNHRGRVDDKNLEYRLNYYYGTTLKDLRPYIDHVINTDELLVDECVESLINL